MRGAVPGPCGRNRRHHRRACPTLGRRPASPTPSPMSGLNVPDPRSGLRRRSRQAATGKPPGRLTAASCPCAATSTSTASPTSLTARHTCAGGIPRNSTPDVERFARVCAVVKALRTARIAQLGARVTPFRTVRYSEKLLQQSGHQRGLRRTCPKFSPMRG